MYAAEAAPRWAQGAGAGSRQVAEAFWLHWPRRGLSRRIEFKVQWGHHISFLRESLTPRLEPEQCHIGY